MAEGTRAVTGAHQRLGLALVVCAPSGTGKSTLIRRLVEEFDAFVFSVSCTTRAPRPGEVDGRDYHFVDHERFQAMIDAGEFAEWAEVHGNFYGTPKGPVREHLAAGRDVLFDIDVQGAMQLKQTMPDAAFVFLLPPSREELERRLTGRGTDDAEAVARRLANARGELERARSFGHWVVNDDLDEAYARLRAVYLAECCRPDLRPGLLEHLLEGWRDDG